MKKSDDEAATTPNIESQAKKRTHRSPDDAIVLDSTFDAPIPKRKRDTSKERTSNSTTTKDDNNLSKEKEAAKNAEYRKIINAYTTPIDKMHPGLCEEYKLHLQKYYTEKSRMTGFHFTSP